MKHKISIIFALVIGVLIGYFINQSALVDSANTGASEPKEKQPLYWVAPMDANYRRDQPGKSPMGMDLVPVYEEGDANEVAGTVTIDPAVENNLGVKTAQVTREKLMPSIDTVGYINFDESRLWQINVRVSGWVEKLYINAVGEQVKKGEVLFTLYSPELVKAQDELLNAYRTGRNVLIRGATDRLLALGVDRQQIRSIARKGKTQQTIKIKALSDGVIASLNIREGGYVSPNQAVISGGPINEVWVDAEVFERQSHWIKKGASAVMRLDSLPGKEWRGEVGYIYPILDAKTRTLRVRLKFANPDGQLKPNMFANVLVGALSEEQVLTIPFSALIRAGGMTRVVLALGQGKYRSARIEVGREADGRIEVLEGLQEGDKIVTSAHFMLDSESSQSADLSRINGVTKQVESIWAKGEITEVMAEQGLLTINHQPVPEWDWPGMVMNFEVADSLDFDSFEKGQNIDFEMQKSASGMYQVSDFKLAEAKAKALWLAGEITMLMADFGMVTVTHTAAPEWGWQAGEMNFSVDESLALGEFKEGQKVRFLIEKQGTDYLLKQLKASEEGL